MENDLIRARVVYDPARDLLVGTVLATGETFETSNAHEMADRLFAAGVRHGQVSMPDWREGDVAPTASEKIALNHRLNRLGRGLR